MIKYIVCISVWLSLLTTGCSVFGQALKNLQITGASQAGFIIAHKADMAHIAQSHPIGMQLDLALQSDGSKEWHHNYNFPLIGLHINYLDMQAPQLLGHALSVNAYMEPIIYRSKRQQLSFRIGTGAVYFSKTFALGTNHTNIAISSPLSLTMMGNLAYTYYLRNNFFIKPAINFIHYSNGGYSMPNAGINIPALSLGLGYNFSESTDLPQRIKSNYISKPLSFHISLAGGVVENYTADPKKYAAWTLSAYTYQQVGRKSALTFGADGFYNLGLKDYMRNDTLYQNLDFRRVGITAGHELLISKLSMLVQLGYYVYMPKEVHSRMYQRYGLKYNVTDKVFMSLALKSHLGRAELLEWGIGVKL